MRKCTVRQPHSVRLASADCRDLDTHAAGPVAADRKPDPADGRVKKLRTTGHSREYWQQRSTDDQRYMLEWFAGLSAPEARALFELLLWLHERVTT